MGTVASRDLRNHTADVLRRVATGERVTITVNGDPVAELGPVTLRRRPFLTRQDLVHLVETASADPALTLELAEISGELTDETDLA